jgi:3-hydroxybutyryl-CoA dehydrogenase
VGVDQGDGNRPDVGGTAGSTSAAPGRVGIVGAGLMGSGIAQVAAGAGWDVVLHDVGPGALDRGLAAIGSSLARLEARGRVPEGTGEAALARITATSDLAGVAGADLVIEAVVERLAVKREVFAALDAVCPPPTVLATNTSAIPVTAIASATTTPERVVGTHFFSPVPMMGLCELVRGHLTSDDALGVARGFAESVGKTCIVVERDVAGFVTTRLVAALAVEAARLVEQGVVSAADLDTACRLAFGHPMGPLATMDLTGVDVMVNATENIYEQTRDTKFAAPEILRRMVDAGRLGRKTGHGFYTY